MAGPQNFGNNPITTRQVSGQQTVTTTQEAPEYDIPEGLPFYYNNMPLSILLIVIGVTLMIAQVLGPLIFLIFFRKKKKYICLKCHREFSKECTDPNVCDICGGEVVPIKDNRKLFR